MTSNAKTIFYYIVIFFCLIFSIYGSTTILYETINRLFSENYAAPDTIWQIRSMTYNIASLIVGGISLAVTYGFLRRLIDQGDVENDFWLRQWATYIIIAIAAVAFIWSSIVLLSDLLSMKEGLHNTLKVLVNLGLSAFVFVFFSYDLKSDYDRKSSVSYSLYALALFIMVFTAFLGFKSIPSQATIKATEVDRKNYENLEKVRSEIEAYFFAENQLPKDLNVLVERRKVFDTDIIDQNTQTTFTYKIEGDSSYEICAQFKTDYKGYTPEQSYSTGETCYPKKLN